MTLIEDLLIGWGLGVDSRQPAGDWRIEKRFATRQDVPGADRGGRTGPSRVPRGASEWGGCAVSNRRSSGSRRSLLLRLLGDRNLPGVAGVQDHREEARLRRLVRVPRHPV